jgi:aminocarboxymuconate-semialdehyde decarboxylase
MNAHNIKTSIISLANPWLDFLHSDDATLSIIASELNDELENLCENSSGRIYGFATLPIKNSIASIKEIHRLKGLKHIKGKSDL